MHFLPRHDGEVGYSKSRADAALCDLRESTLRRLAELTRSFDDIVEASTDVAIDDEHDPEGHTIAWERQQVAALISSERVRLTEVQNAEARVAAGTYGICNACEAPIPQDRLDVLPAAATCVGCGA